MAMGRRRREEQGALWIAASDVPQSGGHPFYQQVNKILDSEGFDRFVEERCRPFYADQTGRPSLPPAVYFRMLMIGYFEGLDSERGIAWRVADSLALRRFLGYGLTDQTADHSTISRNRRLIDVETHQEVFNWVLQMLAKRGLLDGKTLWIDACRIRVPTDALPRRSDLAVRLAA
jgi:transposase